MIRWGGRGFGHISRWLKATLSVLVTIDPPVLTLTSAAGAKPSWSASYPNAVPSTDDVRARYRVNGGAWTTESWQDLTEAILVTGEFVWPVFHATSFSAGQLVEVQEQKGRNVGGGSENLSAWSSTISTTIAATVLNDDFNDNSVDGAKWTTTDAGMYYNTADAALTTGVTVEEAGGQARITPPSSTSGKRENGFKSVVNVNIDEARCFVKVVTDLTTMGGSQQAYFAHGVDKDNSYKMVVSGGLLRCLKAIGGTYTFIDAGGITYSSTNHVWWRIREAGGTIYFDTAPATATTPPIASDWTNRFSEARDAGHTLDAKVGFGSNTFGSTTTVPVAFDNFNMGL